MDKASIGITLIVASLYLSASETEKTSHLPQTLLVYNNWDNRYEHTISTEEKLKESKSYQHKAFLKPSWAN